MRLACDIGNTRTNFALFNRGKILHRFSINTSEITLELLKQYLADYPLPNSIAIGSVVSKKGEQLGEILETLFNITPFIIQHHHQFDIINCYQPPSSAGIDRLINVAFAYHHLQQGVIVIDFGTATTFDIITGGGSFLGGVILPGIKLMRDALGEQAEQLKKVPIQPASTIIGETTLNGIQAGLTYGSLALIEGITHQIHRAYPGEIFQTIITGGFSHFIQKLNPEIALFDHDLTLKGINLIYQLNH